MTYQLAPNIELLFTEAGDYHDRVRAAAAAADSTPSRCGDRPASTRPSTPKDLPALKAALEETGTQLTAQLSEPRTQFMIPPWDHSEFYRKLDEGVEIAQVLGTPAHRRRQRHRFRRLEAPGAARQAHRDLPEGDRADRRIGHHARARAGQRARRPPRFAPGPHGRRRLRRPRRRLAVLRRALRHLPLGRRGRRHGGGARERRIDREVRPARRRPRPRRARHRCARLAGDARDAARRRATTDRSVSSTTRRPHRRSRCGTSETLAAQA